MFTGIIEEKGIIKNLDISHKNGKITVQCNKVLEGTKKGDSIAVNGICLTVVSLTENSFTADIMPETIRCSSFSSSCISKNVNLERALSVQSRFSGHIVSGHIDGTGIIKSIDSDGNARSFTIECKSELLEDIVKKGSVAIDGISLTVARVTDKSFTVYVVPHTAELTTLSEKKKGELVNIETDYIGKYIKIFLNKKKQSSLTLSNLEEMGF